MFGYFEFDCLKSTVNYSALVKEFKMNAVHHLNFKEVARPCGRIKGIFSNHLLCFSFLSVELLQVLMLPLTGE